MKYLVAIILIFGMLLSLGCIDSATSKDNNLIQTNNSLNGNSPNSSTGQFGLFELENPTLKYKDFFRNIDDYDGNSIVFTGEILQVIDNDNNSVDLRLAVTFVDCYFDVSDVVYVWNYTGVTRLLEGDVVKVGGKGNNLAYYETVSGAEVSVPSIEYASAELIGDSSEVTKACNDKKNQELINKNQAQNIDNTTVPKPNPELPVQQNLDLIGISNAYCQNKDNLVACSISVADSKGKDVAVAGTLKFEIKDILGRKLFEKSYSIKVSDYEYTRYSFVIPSKEIQTSFNGRANIEFKLQVGSESFDTIKTLTSLPKLSENEQDKVLLEDYLKTTKTDGRTVSKGDFKVTLKSYGLFKRPSYSEIEEYLRFDVLVENTSSKKQPFYLYPKIKYSGKEYDNSYYSELDSGLEYLEPDMKLEGYILFDIEKIDENILQKEFEYRAGTDYSMGTWDGRYSYKNEYLFEIN